DVGAGREGLFIAGQHDRADRRIGFEIVERRADLGDEGGVQRVERLRPVEGDDADRAAPLEQNIAVFPASHGTAPTLSIAAVAPRSSLSPGQLTGARERVVGGGRRSSDKTGRLRGGDTTASFHK